MTPLLQRLPATSHLSPAAALLLVAIISLTATACTITPPATEDPLPAEHEPTARQPVSGQTVTASLRPGHIAYNPDSGTPWWAVIARQQSGMDTDATTPWFNKRTLNELASMTPLPPARSSQELDDDIAADDDEFADDSVVDGQASESDEADTALSVATTNGDDSDDLWQHLRQGFRLAGKDHRFVRPYVEWYASHQDYIDRVVERARPFLYDIVQAVEAHNMPLEIALLPVVESAFQPFAYSPGRAAGIWQFIPATGKRYGLKQNWWYDGRRDVHAATKAALDYLDRLQQRFDGDWLLALASYNSGEGRVIRAVKKNQKKGRPTDFWSLDLPDETQGYVPKLLAISAIVANSAAYNVQLDAIPNEPYLERVDIGSQIDLALAAELAELPIKTMYNLNPAFNRWATDPDGPHVLSLPIDKAEPFRQALAKVDDKHRIRWQRHRIRQGETLGHIARKFQTSVDLLQEVNNIRDKWIRAGDSIIIPVATKDLKHFLSQDQRRLALQRTERRGIKVKHMVRSGDTFWDLSRKFKVSVGQLASWNGMSPKDSLMPGQRLVIWAKNRNIVNTRYAAPPSSATRQQLHYKVRKGDSLARIAKKFSVTVAKLRSWNSLPKGKYLQPGQRLTLYVDVTQQS
jgi:membrane-bound lytic murein transglycosylase D